MLDTWRKILLAIIFVSYSSVSLSEDIDLFTGITAPGSSDAPNILVILDNTANWNSAFVNEVAALSSVLNDLEENKFKFGLMMFTESGGDNKNPDGAYVRAALRKMDITNKPLYQNLVNSLDKLGDKSNGGKLGVTMAEAYYYFSGDKAYAGHNKVKRDYTGNKSGNAASNDIYALFDNAFASSTSNVYESPIDSGCQKNFIIYISNGPVQDNSSDTVKANTQLTAIGGNASEISIFPNGSQSNVGDEWARFMAREAPVNVVTYTIDVDPGGTGQGPGFTALLKSMAKQGKGKYFAVDSSVNGGEQISVALKQILSEIQAVNSVFASASLPVSVNTQGTYLNQIFIGMFRPDASASPRWNGNLKQYQFVANVAGNGFELNLADADEVLAINKNTGFITQCARSFWTPDTASLDTYWSFDPEGNCASIANSSQSNTPDGDIVEKGAAGYELRAINPLSRNVKTCNPGSCSGLTNFESDNIALTQNLLGAASISERVKIISWVRGMDVNDENLNGDFTEMRPSVHGDVVHSRPVAVDYGGGTGVVVFYGANDGMLHAVNGNQSNSIGTFLPGSELWSFIAPEHYGKFKRLYDNSPAITLPSMNNTMAKPYFFDGPITAYKDSNSVWVFAAQRRGGRMLYAFDASNPINPSLKWRQGCPNLTEDTDCTSSGFVDIGQTWSAAKILKSSGYLSGSKPMLIMGGGYDICEDGVDISGLNTCTSSPKGNKVFVIDADSGALLNSLSTDRSVVGDITVVKNALTGMAEYAYAADTGGNVYRITIGSSIPASWTIMKIASLGCNTTSCPGGVANRKFLFAPEVVVTPDYNAILIGSGDRERPLLDNAVTTSVDNAFFMIKDKPSDSGWWLAEAGNCQSQSLACLASLLEIDPDNTAVPSDSDLDDKKGWYLAFGASGTSHDKEQVVTSAIVVLGVLTFSTHTPVAADPNSCGSNLGLARVYNIGFLDARQVGAERFTIITGGGLPPSPVAGMVTVTNPNTGADMTLPFVIGANSDSALEGKAPLPLKSLPNIKSRAYWYLQQ